MKPIYKLNGGIGATLCHLCRTIITIGRPANILYCDRCLAERNNTEAEFLKLKANLKKMITGTEQTVKWTETLENTMYGGPSLINFYKQMDKEVPQNRSDLNK